MGQADQRVAAVARRQHSIVTIAELREAGLSDDQIDYRVAQRRLETVHAGVYAMPGVRPTFEQRVLAARRPRPGAAADRERARGPVG